MLACLLTSSTDHHVPIYFRGSYSCSALEIVLHRFVITPRRIKDARILRCFNNNDILFFLSYYLSARHRCVPAQMHNDILSFR